ncbi:MAG: hypothetical protein P8104_09625 [Gammaproteobacteria bacterium]
MKNIRINYFHHNLFSNQTTRHKHSPTEIIQQAFGILRRMDQRSGGGHQGEFPLRQAHSGAKGGFTLRILRTVTQHVVHQHQGHHRFRCSCRSFYRT